MDFIKKHVKYAESGVREYWIVDSLIRRVLVYFFEKDVFPVQYTFEDSIPVGITDGFSIDFTTLDF